MFFQTDLNMDLFAYVKKKKASSTKNTIKKKYQKASKEAHSYFWCEELKQSYWKTDNL